MEIGEIARAQFLNTRVEQSVPTKVSMKLDQAPNKIESNKTEQEGAKEQEDSRGQEKQILLAIEKANGKFESHNNQLSFAVHEATKQIMVKVIDKDTKEVIREIPSEKVLDMVADRMETAGLFVDEKR